LLIHDIGPQLHSRISQDYVVKEARVGYRGSRLVLDQHKTTKVRNFLQTQENAFYIPALLTSGASLVYGESIA
jgi:hypothetical protein